MVLLIFYLILCNAKCNANGFKYKKSPLNKGKKEARDGDRTLLYKISKTPLFIAIPLFIGSVAFYIIVIEVTKKVCFG